MGIPAELFHRLLARLASISAWILLAGLIFLGFQAITARADLSDLTAGLLVVTMSVSILHLIGLGHFTDKLNRWEGWGRYYRVSNISFSRKYFTLRALTVLDFTILVPAGLLIYGHNVIWTTTALIGEIVLKWMLVLAVILFQKYGKMHPRL